jgi:hypothetical protein
MTALWSSVVGGFAGTLVMTTMVRSASEIGLTRMDLPFLLGTAVTDNRRKAKVIGYCLHFALGVAFALAYWAVFDAIGWSSWWLGALIGALQALFNGTVLVNELLPIVHPRMGTPDTAANDVTLLEPPGFLMLNYGRNAFLVSLTGHMVYGAIVGWTIRI